METNTLENLSKEQLIYYQELFSIFDKEDTGCLPTNQFPTFVRGLGHCPTENQIRQMKTTLDPNNEGYIPFANIISLLLKRPKEQNIEQQLMEAFEAIQSLTSPLSEGEKNYKWSVREAKRTLMEHGQMMSETEAEKFQQFLDQCKLKEGNDFNYRDLSKIMAYSYQNQ